MARNCFHIWIENISRHRYLLLLLCSLSFLSIIDIPSSPVFGMPEVYQVLYLVSVSVFKGLILQTVTVIFFKRIRPVVWLCIGVFALLAITNVVAFKLYGIGISRKLLLIFAQTTASEVKGFLPGLIHNITAVIYSSSFYMTLGCTVLLIYIVCILPSRWFSFITICLAGGGLLMFSSFCVQFSSGRSAHIVAMRIVKYGMEVWSGYKEYESLLKNKRPLPFKDTIASSHRAPVVVVVLGESGHRRHHSLYGYPLLTTPLLNALSDSLIVFTDVIGSSVSTAGNMERILSFKEDDTTCGDGLDYPLVIDLFKEMGYKTFWLSNQERTGSVSNTSGVMAMNAEVIEYVGADNSEDAMCVRYDEALLPSLDNAMSDTVPYRLIFMHLLGSHVEYKTRYPYRFEYFSGKEELDTFKYSWLDKKMAQRRAEYDNSIRYSDYIIGYVIGAVSGRDVPALVIYFSDHGEEVYDFSSYTGRNDNSVQVPFIVYANGAYKRQNPDIMERLNDCKDKPMSTANFVHLLISLTGGEYSMYDSELDVSHEDYRIRPRYVDEKIWTYDK